MEGKLRFGGKFDLDRGEIDRELRNLLGLEVDEYYRSRVGED